MRPAATSRIHPALLRRSQRVIEGIVWDPFHGRPVSGARLRLRGSEADGEVDCVADAQGRLSTSALRDGRYAASVSAPGFVTLTFRIELPHRGELRGFRIDLEPVRARALRLWRERAEPFASAERLWLRTPAELAAEQRGLAFAARAFERIFYAGGTPDEAGLDAILRGGEAAAPR